MAVYDVYTDLDPDTLTEVTMAVYREWVKFALGQASAVGHILQWPTGRYAASLYWQKTGRGRISIIADEAIAPEAKYIEDGTSEADMRAAMLYGPGAKISKTGERYRTIPMRTAGRRPSVKGAGQVLNSIKTSGRGEHMDLGVASIWGQRREHTDPRRRHEPGSAFVTMSEKSTANEWKVPAMPAYAPASILSTLIKQALRK